MTTPANDAAPTALVGTTGSECLSCVGCKWLYQEGTGYSNYTWEDDDVRCALDRNPNLPAERPSDWTQDAATDNWPLTNRSRCERYAPGEFVALDVDGENGPADCTQDDEQIRVICEHSGRKPHGS